MSKLLDRFRCALNKKAIPCRQPRGSGDTYQRDWEDGYRQRWRFDESCAQPTASTARAPLAGGYVKTVTNFDVGNPANQLPAHTSRFTKP